MDQRHHILRAHYPCPPKPTLQNSPSIFAEKAAAASPSCTSRPNPNYYRYFLPLCHLSESCSGSSGFQITIVQNACAYFQCPTHLSPQHTAHHHPRKLRPAPLSHSSHRSVIAQCQPITQFQLQVKQFGGVLDTSRGRLNIDICQTITLPSHRIPPIIGTAEHQPASHWIQHTTLVRPPVQSTLYISSRTPGSSCVAS